jgi:hypothetical protein
VAAVARGGLSGAALDAGCLLKPLTLALSPKGRGDFFRGTDQLLKRFLRATAQLTSQQQREEAAPPPGREVEVSIEADERAAFPGFG